MIIDAFHPPLIPPIKGGKLRTYPFEISKSRFAVMFIYLGPRDLGDSDL